MTSMMIGARRHVYGIVGAAAALWVTSAGCKSTVVVAPAIECADPCCGGNSSAIDCGEHPNVTCVEDASPCVAKSYGCADGSFFLAPPSQPGCEADASDLLVVDVGAGPADAPDASGPGEDDAEGGAAGGD
jgi:hypothetical protein